MSRVLYLLLILPVASPVWLLGKPADSPAVELRIIVVESATQAENILLRLKNGADFAQLAKAFSIDPSAFDGGYMGPTDPLTLRAEVRDALRSTAAGQITGVIHTQSGYAIQKVISPAESGALRNTASARILPSFASGAIRNTPQCWWKRRSRPGFPQLSQAGGLEPGPVSDV